MTARHLISLRDLSDDDIAAIVQRGTEIAAAPRAAGRALDGHVVGIWFTRTSTRTRTSFSVGALRQGAQVVAYGPEDLQVSTGETLEDTGRVMAGMLDALVARTAGPPAQLRALAAHGLPVINAMSADEHPTQALADLTTLALHFGTVDGLRLLYVGEGNNTAAALALALPRFRGVDLEIRTPPGYGLDPAVLAEATASAARTGSRIRERHDMAQLPADVDVVYTTRWQTTGTSKPDPGWRDTFEPFRVDEAVLAGHPKALFLHDLPAHRGEEVSAGVLDGPASIAFVQAGHKLHSAMAVLQWCLGAL